MISVAHVGPVCLHSAASKFKEPMRGPEPPTSMLPTHQLYDLSCLISSTEEFLA